MVEICRRYGWTSQEYYSQPNWFIDLIVGQMSIDARKAEHKSKG